MSAESSFSAGFLPLAKNALDTATSILQKAEVHPDAAKLHEARITDDMLPLSFQIYMLSDSTQKLVARASGTEPLTLDRDAVKTFADYYKLLDQVKGLVASADTQLIDSRATATVSMGMGPGKTVHLPVHAYVQGYALPNVFFHLTTAYTILRKEGVQLGKQDFIKSFLGPYAP